MTGGETMLALIKYEWKKLCTYRLIPVVLLLLIAVNGYLIFHAAEASHIQSEDALDRIVSDYAADPEGMEHYIDSCVKAYETAWSFGDKSLLPEPRYTDESDILFYESHFFPLRDYTEQYQKTVKTAIRIAEGHITEYRYLGYEEDLFETQYQKGVIASYEKLTDLTFPFVNVRGYDILLDYEGLGVLVMIAALMGGMFILIPERNEKSRELVFATKYGRGATFGAKMVTAFLYTVAVSAILTASAVVAVWARYGLYGLFAPLQMVENYRLSPLVTTVLGGLVAAFLLRVFSSFVFMVLVMAFTSLVSGYVPAFFAGSLVIAFNYFIATKEYFNAYDPLKNLNFFWTIGGRAPLVAWRGIRLFDHCIGAVGAIVIVYSAFLLLGLAISWYAYVGNHGVTVRSVSRIAAKFRGIIQIRLPEKKTRSRAMLLTLELKKWMTPFHVFVLTGAVIFAFIMCSEAYHERATFDEEVYDEYMQTYEGVWSPEKDECLQKEYEEMLSLIAKKERMTESYVKGTISYAEYQIYQLSVTRAESRIEVVEELSSTSSYLRTLSEEGRDAYFVNERGWRRLYDANFSVYYLFAIIFLFSGMFASDHKENFVPIRRATQSGRGRVVLCRVLIACVTVILMIVICEWMQYSAIQNTAGFSLPEASVESLSFLNIEGMSVSGYFILMFMRQLAVGIGFALLTLFVSEKTKGYLATLLIMTLIAFVPAAFSWCGFDLFDGWSLVRLLGHN